MMTFGFYRVYHTNVERQNQRNIRNEHRMFQVPFLDAVSYLSLCDKHETHAARAASLREWDSKHAGDAHH